MVDVACETDDCLWMLDIGQRRLHDALHAEIAQLKEEKCSLQTEVINLKKRYKVYHYLLSL